MNLETILPQLLREIKDLPMNDKIRLLRNVELLPSELDDFCAEVEGILDANFDERVYDWMREKTSKDQMLELATLIDICDPGLDPEWIKQMNQAICAQQSGTPSDTLQFVFPYYYDNKGNLQVKKPIHKARLVKRKDPRRPGFFTAVVHLNIPMDDITELQFTLPCPSAPHIVEASVKAQDE